MIINKLSQQDVRLSVSMEELIFLSNAINETLAALEDWEFQTRTGTPRERAVELHQELLRVIDQRPRDPSVGP